MEWILICFDAFAVNFGTCTPSSSTSYTSSQPHFTVELVYCLQKETGAGEGSKAAPFI